MFTFETKCLPTSPFPFAIRAPRLAIGALCVLLSGCLSSGENSANNAAGVVSVADPSESSSSTSSNMLVGCVDSSGNAKAEGDTWSVVHKLAFAKCGSAENYTAQTEQINYVCRDASVWITADQVVPATVDASCPAAQLSASVDSGTLNISSSNVTAVSYTCSTANASSPAYSGSIPAGSQTVGIDPTLDLSCSVTATDILGATMSVTADQDGNCGNKIKVNGSCQDFSCKQFLAINADPNGVLQVPARTTDGQCYAVKIFSAIANSPSSLTGVTDADVISRNHDVSYANAATANVHNPWLMGKALINFMTMGPRTVKLAGSGDSLAPILVDNFVLSGIYPTGTASPGASYFRAYGTSDSAIGLTGAISFLGSPVAIQAFGSGGTSTVESLDITTQVTADHSFTLDVRAEDCGGSRQLSDLYLVFQ